MSDALSPADRNAEITAILHVHVRRRVVDVDELGTLRRLLRVAGAEIVDSLALELRIALALRIAQQQLVRLRSIDERQHVDRAFLDRQRVRAVQHALARRHGLVRIRVLDGLDRQQLDVVVIDLTRPKLLDAGFERARFAEVGARAVPSSSTRLMAATASSLRPSFESAQAL